MLIVESKTGCMECGEHGLSNIKGPPVAKCLVVTDYGFTLPCLVTQNYHFQKHPSDAGW